MVPKLGALRIATTEELQVSVVLPAYNEAEYLAPAVKKNIQTLTEFTQSFEIIIAEDGSTDGTAEKAEQLAEENPQVKHIHRDQRLGRGTALNNAFRQSQGQTIVYMDLDMATDMQFLKPLIEAITKEGYDFSTGSRMLPESNAERTLGRSVSSKTYNFLVRKMLGSKLHDHQCGFKAFRRTTVFSLLDEVKAKHWFWDTEILVRAQLHGYKVKEIAVNWKSGRATKVNLMKDSWNMFRQVIKLWWGLRKEK